MKTKRLFASLLCIATLLLLTPRAAFANSAPKFWLGADAFGSVTADKNCPITVENELLTFDIPNFPKNSGSNNDYTASVTAQYTFFNPTNETITARLEFPFGEAPDYDTGEDDLTKYDITVNGSAIEKTVRHTLMPNGRFELDSSISQIIDDFKEDNFFTPELPVTKYVFDILDYDKNVSARAAFDFPKYRYSRVYLDGMNDCVELSNSHRLGRIAGYSNNTLTVYVFGDQLDKPPEWTFYSDRECSVRVDGTTKLISADEMTFKEFVLSIYPENSGPLESDWFNAVIDDLNMNRKGSVIKGAKVFNTKRANLMRWYEYDITIPPGGRIVNTVTAPIYPDIEGNSYPSYNYTYLLSPAQSWADFGSLEVVVNTPYYLKKTTANTHFDSFENTETGYKALFDALPEGELVFTLREKENFIADITEGFPLWLVFFVLVGYVGAIVGLCLGVAAIVKYLRKKK